LSNAAILVNIVKNSQLSEALWVEGKVAYASVDGRVSTNQNNERK
jgi:hypothetical protein